jgi:hypothetical protein
VLVGEVALDPCSKDVFDCSSEVILYAAVFAELEVQTPTIAKVFESQRNEPNLALSAARMHNCNYSHSNCRSLRTGLHGQVMPSTGHSKYVTNS